MIESFAAWLLVLTGFAIIGLTHQVFLYSKHWQIWVAGALIAALGAWAAALGIVLGLLA